jgi:hypothetical protein
MAVFALARTQDEKFKPVLSWTAKNDPQPQVRKLAALLSGSVAPVLSNTERTDTNDINPPNPPSAD